MSSIENVIAWVYNGTRSQSGTTSLKPVSLLHNILYKAVIIGAFW